MVDIHTHILPHIDDGAKDTKMAIAMLNSLREQGMRTVALTPHYYGRRTPPSEFIKRRNAIYEQMKAQVPEDMEIRLGAEVHFTGLNMPPSEDLATLAIEGTRYVLVEFPFETRWKANLFEKLLDFIRETEYLPIIAHAERYLELQKNPALVTELVRMGCLIQVNAPAFLCKKGSSFAFALLKNGFVHCIGTDAHDIDEREPKYNDAKELVIKKGYGEAWAQAENIMKDLMSNARIHVEVGKPIKKIFGRYF